jgi:hypothetical protein
MNVARIGHASLVVSTRQVRCFMDPILVSPFEAGFIEFDPPLAIDARAFARERCDVLIVSHAHLDHFCVRSLDRFHRDCVVLHPSGSDVIASALRRLGFPNVHALGAGEQIRAGDLTICATPSKVDFPEMGILFRSRGVDGSRARTRTVWNMVDSAVDDAGREIVRAFTKRVDLLLAGHNPLLGASLSRGALGADFPFEHYGQLLRNVFDIRPRCVVPGSCGFRTREPWVNDRYFPMTEAQFLADVGAVDPSIARRLLPPASSVRVGGSFPVRERALRFVRLRSRAKVPAHDWRPDWGVPRLVDRNPRDHATATLRARVRAYLANDLFRALQTPSHALWRERMARHDVLWRLEVVYPGGEVDARMLDFRRRRLAWRAPQAGDFAKITTTVAASAIIDLLDGTTVPMNVLLGGLRTVHRVYEPFRGGVRDMGGDDPLARALYPGADERHVDRELRALGY